MTHIKAFISLFGDPHTWFALVGTGVTFSNY
jgi:hypothetical protein